MASLFVDIWHGTMDCDDYMDSKTNWTWRILVVKWWVEHGRAVTAIFLGVLMSLLTIWLRSWTHSTRHANSSLGFIIFVWHYSMGSFQMNTGITSASSLQQFASCLSIGSPQWISAGLANGLLNGKKSSNSCIISDMSIGFILFSHAFTSQTTWPWRRHVSVHLFAPHSGLWSRWLAISVKRSNNHQIHSWTLHSRAYYVVRQMLSKLCFRTLVVTRIQPLMVLKTLVMAISFSVNLTATQSKALSMNVKPLQDFFGSLSLQDSASGLVSASPMVKLHD